MNPPNATGQPVHRHVSDDPLDSVLCSFSEEDHFTLRDACQGVQIFGETGSGKTSGSGKLLAQSYLSAGFGGLVLTVNPDEADRWRRYAAATGRSEDLIFFGPTHPHAFNFFTYEAQNALKGVGLSRTLANLFQTLAELETTGSDSSASLNEGFWKRELDKIVIHAINLLRFAGEEVSLQAIYDVVLTAPQSRDDVAKQEVREASACLQAVEKAQKRAASGEIKNGEHYDCFLATRYWEGEFPDMDERPRTSIQASFSGIAMRFLSERFRSLLCEQTTLTPEVCFDGKIIILDLPVKLHSSQGVFAQAVFKYCWQKAVERRAVGPDARPLFLWADEAQYFLNSHDVLFQSTARSSRVCTVYLTQNLPSYKYTMGTRGGQLAHSLLGNLTTKIFHRNNCAHTNSYASELFAKSWQNTPTTSVSERQGRSETNFTTRTELREQLIPLQFTQLASGGTPNNFLVEGIVHIGGRTFKTSEANSLVVVFNQRA